ncbi:MAG TPA: hypothetical protein PKH07_18110, partial [bacterium]|nr:hypothetical protein [bacterium]
MSLVSKLVEVHLLNGNRFLGKVKEVDAYGVTVFCIPLTMLEGAVEARNILDDLRIMRHTLFFPHANIEYIDIGGEPLGFDHLFRTWFGSVPLDEFFKSDVV